jgi:hypothetical protein
MMILPLTAPGRHEERDTPVQFLARITAYAYGSSMMEHEDLREDLTANQVLAGIAWAVAATQRRLLQDAEGEPAYKQTWIGQTAHSLMCDRLDRVFSCGDYAHESGQHEVGLDVLHAGLNRQEIETMPRVAPGTVTRDDLNGSPGWLCGQWRWLMSSFLPFEVEAIKWAVKRPTKQRVAQQALGRGTVPHEVLPLFEMEAAAFAPAADGITTLVLVHAFDVQQGSSESYLGRSQYNPRGESPWHWKEPISATTLALATEVKDGSRVASLVDVEMDAPVRLRREPLREDDAASATDQE